MLTLIRPDVRLRRSYLEAHDEFDGAHRDGDGEWVEPQDDGGYAGAEFTREELETEAGFTRFVRWKLDRARDDSPRPTGHVPCTFFWVVDDSAPSTYLASVSVRHSLTPFLLEYGGHIGYSVRPSARRRGIATGALRLALPEAAALGIDPALLTCHVSNAVSARVIETNGGVFEDVRGTQRRYWVPTG
ncbi:MAG TPA: GNAT family N-acetyltransferase [Ornithinibacter sp.]|nr:GNAT family N-acetyltransferase [Ornithinibacter sp.]